jgi:hypothetical protein
MFSSCYVFLGEFGVIFTEVELCKSYRLSVVKAKESRNRPCVAQNFWRRFRLPDFMKESRNRPCVAQSFRGGLGFQIS